MSEKFLGYFLSKLDEFFYLQTGKGTLKLGEGIVRHVLKQLPGRLGPRSFSCAAYIMD